MKTDIVEFDPSHGSAEEIARARRLASSLAAKVRVSKTAGIERVSLDLGEAEELCDLLHDSLRTIERMASQ
jgi:hypothetical protein